MEPATVPPASKMINYLIFALMALLFHFPHAWSEEPEPHEPLPGLVLVEQGEGRASIVIPPEPSRMNQLAAEELQIYIQRISGAELPIVTKPATDGSVNLFVGDSGFTRELGISTEGLEGDAFVMRTGDNWLALVGDDTDFQPCELDAVTIEDRARVQEEWARRTAPDFFENPFGRGKDRERHTDTGWWQGDRRGSLQAVYEFLRRQGVRWYMPGAIGEVVPESTTIVAAPVDEVIKPDFVLRHLLTRWDILSREEVLWQLRLGVNYGHEFYGTSNNSGLNNVTGHKETKAAHPEYYAVWDGRVQTGFGPAGAQRLSSEELFEATVRFCRAAFDLYDEPAVEISLADNQGKPGWRSEHPDCVARYTPERPRGIQSDYYWSFLQRVAEELQKTHPGKFIIGSAYQTQILPPLQIDKLPPNVIVRIARPDRFRMHQEPLQEDGEIAKRQLLEEWAGKVTSGKMYGTEYYLYARPNRGEWVGVPIYFPSAISEDLRHMKSLSMAGESLPITSNQDSKTPIHEGAVPWGERGHLYAPGFAHLNLYLTTRLYWDVDQDVDALLEEYCAKFFGPAAKTMREFIDYCEKNWAHMSPVSGDPKIRAHALDLLARAQTQATASPYRERVGFLTEYVQPMVLAQQATERGIPDRKQVVAQRRTHSTAGPVDGRICEDLWQGTRQYSFGVDASSDEPPSTIFRAFYAGDHLHFAIRCNDPHETDYVAVLTGSPAHQFYEIGIHRDGSIVTRDHKAGARPDWTAPVRAAVHEGEEFWSAEIQFPINPDEDLMVEKADGVVGRMPSAFAPWVFDVIRRKGQGADARQTSFSGGAVELPYDPATFTELIVQ